MKHFLFFIMLLSIAGITGNVFAGADLDRHKSWLVDSYNYGKDGNNCSSILYDYGTPNWTLNSDDPTILKKFHNACKAGKSDATTGLDSLSQLLDDFDNNK